MAKLHRNKADGLAARTWLRTWVVPRLYVGCRVPSGPFLGLRLGIDPSSAAKHMRRVLLEDGIATEVRRVGTGCRVFVTAMPAERAAA